MFGPHDRHLPYVRRHRRSFGRSRRASFSRRAIFLFENFPFSDHLIGKFGRLSAMRLGTDDFGCEPLNHAFRRLTVDTAELGDVLYGRDGRSTFVPACVE
jgi:hypothetical protein